MNEYVVDTVALILRLESRQMGGEARQIFVEMEQHNARLHVPTFVFAEILYLSERHRVATSLDSVRAYLKRFPNCVEAPLTLAIVTAAEQITDIPELHDGLIATTARQLKLPLLTNELTIGASSHVETIW